MFSFLWFFVNFLPKCEFLTTRKILSPLRLPIPPQRHILWRLYRIPKTKLGVMRATSKKKTLHRLRCRVFWRRHPDLNRGIKVLQTLALPLGYSAILRLPLGKKERKNSADILERETRFEPATFTLARWRSTTELFPHILSALFSYGGSYRVRTYDPLLVRQMLSQLS